MNNLDKIFQEVDILDLAMMFVLCYLLVVTTLGYVDPDMSDPAIEWTGFVLAFFLGKKTPNVLGFEENHSLEKKE